MIIRYVAPIFSCNSDGELARGYVMALSDKFTLNILNTKVSDNTSYLNKGVVEYLTRHIATEVPYNCIIHHVSPPEMEMHPGKINIGIVSPKTNVMPNSWVDPCNKLDLIITPSKYCNNSIVRSGVLTNVEIVPPVVDAELFRPTSPISLGADLAQFKILTIFKNTHSSNWVNLCMAYLQEFTAEDDIVLIVNSSEPLIQDALAAMSSQFPSPPQIYVIVSPINDSYLPNLFSIANLFFLPASGKSLGISYLQAAACGTPILCTDTGGHMEYIHDANPYTVDSTFHPAAHHSNEPYYNECMMWYRPIDMCGALRRVYEELREGITIQPYIPPQCNPRAVSAHLCELLSTLESTMISEFSPYISIIILSYNNLSMLRRTLDTLYDNTTYPHYEVIIVENGSDQSDTDLFEYLMTLDCKVIYSKDNLGFGPGNNLGVVHSSGNILLFLNNDTEPTVGWLGSIVSVFDNDNSVGVVGSKLLFPNMTIQHVGISLKHPGTEYAIHPYIGNRSDYPPTNISREVHAVTGACLAIRRRIFKEVGGFDPIYERGYYEDSDLCMKVRELGYKVVIEPESVVIHKVGSSFSKLGVLRTQDFFVNNENTFKARWNGKLLNDEYLFRSSHYYTPDRKNIGILDSHMETYGGGEKEAVCTASSLEMDNNVDIIMRIPNNVTRKSIERNMGIRLRHTELVTLLSAEPIHLYRNYDVFWNNEWRSNIQGCGNYNILRVMFPHKYEALTWLDSYDMILANSKYTQRYIGEYWGVDSEVLYPPVTMMGDLNEVDDLMDNKRNYILTVGRFFQGEHCKKHKVMIEAWKKLNLPDWEFHIVGVVKDNPQDIKYYDECVKLAAGHDNIIFHPNISYDELRQLYRISKIYWHATGYGEDDPLTAEHFGISPVEAMSAGCYPVLINKGGLPEIHDGVWNTIDELIEHTRWLAEWDPGFLPEMKIAMKFSMDKYMEGVVDIVSL